MKEDREIVIAACQGKGGIGSYLPKIFEKDRDVILVAASNDYEVLNGSYFYKDEEIVAAAQANNKRTLEYCENMEDKIPVATIMIAKKERVLKDLPAELRDNYDIV